MQGISQVVKIYPLGNTTICTKSIFSLDQSGGPADIVGHRCHVCVCEHYVHLMCVLCRSSVSKFVCW